MFEAHKDYAKSNESQTVLDITSKCTLCGKFEVFSFNIKIT